MIQLELEILANVSIKEQKPEPLIERRPLPPPDWEPYTGDCIHYREVFQNSFENQNGHGICRNGEVVIPAHKAVYEAHHGKKTRPGMVIRHKCETPWCVNPDHLIEGTAEDNRLDYARANQNAGIVLKTDRRTILLWERFGLSKKLTAARIGVAVATINTWHRIFGIPTKTQPPRPFKPERYGWINLTGCLWSDQ